MSPISVTYTTTAIIVSGYTLDISGPKRLLKNGWIQTHVENYLCTRDGTRLHSQLISPKYHPETNTWSLYIAEFMFRTGMSVDGLMAHLHTAAKNPSDPSVATICYLRRSGRLATKASKSLSA